MKRLFVKIFSLWLCLCVLFSVSSANMNYTGKRADDPMATLWNMISDNNGWYYSVQDTALDRVDDEAWLYGDPYKITNTLDFFRRKIDPYMQWAVYIWLVAATIALIYMWFLLVTNWVIWKWDISKLKTNMLNVVIWVLLLVGFYTLIKIIVAVINMVFG